MSNSLDDPDLAKRIRRRDPAAIQLVVDAYLAQIFRAARGAGLDLQTAEDVTQTTFTTFIESAHRFEGRSHVRTWLFGILYRKISESRRRSGRDTPVEDIDAIVDGRYGAEGRWTSPPRPIEMGLVNVEIRVAFRACLAGVPAKQAMAFVLREVEGMESGEICKILDVTRTNFGVLLYRSRNRLRECLERRGFEG